MLSRKGHHRSITTQLLFNARAAVPAGLGYSLILHEHWLAALLSFACAIGSGVWLFRDYLVPVSTEEYRDTDYTPQQKLMLYLPIFPWSLILPLPIAQLDGVLHPAASIALTAAVATIGLAFQILGTNIGPRRVGKRRIQQALRKSDMEEITSERLELVARHPKVLRDLAAVGAGDNVFVMVAEFAGAIHRDTDEVITELETLRKAHLVEAKKITVREQPHKWQYSLTPTGIQCLQHYQQGR